ncbi:peptide-methionine (R)-S-oxide reductase MsrB [Candidatus Saccharibacteria bacterium]|nr:peptide-methionine (R)-S-oxide reductase MsrB [Candidatus Saccharibacteria bacterium]
MSDDMKNKPEEYWKEKLTPEQYRVLREKGTEMAFTGKYVDNHDDGTYTCGACGHELFASGTKFDSGSGWPSFTDPLNQEHVELHDDTSFGARRTEVTCANCGAHLGHVFDDGPVDKGGQRYCINSVSLDFEPKKDA